MRISNSTTLIPIGLYKVKEDEEREIEDEETPIKLSSKHCWKIDNWVHLTPNILKQGRIVREEPEFIVDFDNDDEQTKIKQKLIQNDPYMLRLAPIMLDKRNIKR